MATLVNDKDIALQASPYRNKTTLVAVSSTVSNFTVAKNGGPVSPANTVLTAVPNVVFTNAATYTWDYSLNTSPTTWKGFVGGLIPGTTTFTKSINAVSIDGTGVYNNVTGTTITGTGSGAVFNISKGVIGTNYSNANITIVNGGTGYQPGDKILISGTSLGYTAGALLSTTTLSKSGTAATAAINVTGVVGTSNGPGTGAIFTIVKAAGQTNYSSATITVTNGGSGYVQNNTITILGSSLGTGHGNLILTITGTPSIATSNDLTLTVQGQVLSLTGTTQTITNATIKGIIGSSNASSIIFRCTVTEPLLESAYGQVVVAYTQEQANSDSINIELSKVAATISLSATGVGVYTGTGTTISVTRGGTSLIYDNNGGSSVSVATPNSFKVEIVQDQSIDPTVPLRTVGTFSNTTNNFVFSGITAITSDYATVTFLVIIYDASGNKTQTTYKQIQYSRVSSGVQGADAILNYIETSAPVLIKSSPSIYELGDFVQITINGKRTVGGVTSNYGFITITGNGDTESTTATDVSSSGITTSILNSSQKNKYIVKLYSAANTGSALLLDTQTIPVVFTGGNAVVGALSNENVTVPVGPGGIIPSGAYDSTGTLIRVFDGATELTYATGTTTTITGKWVISNVTISTGLTIGTITAVSSTKYASISKIIAMSGINVATIQFDIAGINGAGKAFTITLTQTINKGQPGSDAIISYLEIPTPIISKSTGLITTDGLHSSIVITGKYISGTAAPINAGYISAAPKVKVTDFKTDNKVYCTGVSAFAVNDPIVFSGINLPTNITAGFKYFIKTIDLVNKAVTISTSLGGSTITWISTTEKLGLTQAYAVSEKTTLYNISITTNIPNDAGIYSLIVNLYNSSNIATASLLDTQEVLVLFKGSNTVSAILTNDSVGIPFVTDINGSITASTGAYTGSGTVISVYEGVTELTYDGNGTAVGTWKVTAVGNNISVGTITASGNTASISDAAAITAATASITFTITGKSTGGEALSITKKQTFSRNIGGKPGNDGLSYKVNILTAFAWTNTGTNPVIAGTFNYNWSTQAVTANTGVQTTGANIGYPIGWTKEAGASTGNGQTLYQLTLNITALSTATSTTNIAWSGAKVNRMGYRSDGSIGWTGDSARIAYTKKTLTAGNTVATEAAPAAPVGNSLPITSGSYTWTANPPTIVAGEIMYQSDGFYVATSPTTGSITWGTPYLSSFKVGQLSAITADLGAITAGRIDIGPNVSAGDVRFSVSTTGQVTIKGPPGGSYMQITNDVIKVYDSGLRLQLGNLDV